MTSEPLVVDCLINSSFYVKSMIDTGCLCFAVFDENLVRAHELYTIEISPRSLRLADGKIGARITHIASVDMDIDGRQEKVWGLCNVTNSIRFHVILCHSIMFSNFLYCSTMFYAVL